MKKEVGLMSVSWQSETVSDAAERLELAFGMLFLQLTSKALVDKSKVDDLVQKCN
jgi:hypothetical protein